MIPRKIPICPMSLMSIFQFGPFSSQPWIRFEPSSVDSNPWIFRRNFRTKPTVERLVLQNMHGFSKGWILESPSSSKKIGEGYIPLHSHEFFGPFQIPLGIPGFRTLTQARKPLAFFMCVFFHRKDLKHQQKYPLINGCFNSMMN